MINSFSFETSLNSNPNDSGFCTEVPTLQKLSQSQYTPGISKRMSMERRNKKSELERAYHSKVIDEFHTEQAKKAREFSEKWYRRSKDTDDALKKTRESMDAFESFFDEVLERSEKTLKELNMESTQGSPSSVVSIRTPETVKRRINRAVHLVKNAKKLDFGPHLCSTPNNENEPPRLRSYSAKHLPRPKSELMERPVKPPKPLFLQQKPRESSF